VGVTIDRETVLRVAALAKLDLERDAVEVFRRQLQAVLEYVRILDSLEVGEILPAELPRAEGQPLREDDTRPCLPIQRALANAPDAALGHFRVPRVLPE
jgi:aspartyl-tRNA(Asn)/glutamyl-tRNA(Gln) amidotransferase subunit C